MNFDELRRRADVVRQVPLETVLIFRGAVRDRHDRSKWHTEQGPLTLSGPKFMNWRREIGGGGAIDLVMHLAGIEFLAAVAWLEQHLSAGHAAGGEITRHATFPPLSVAAGSGRLRLPAPNDQLLHCVVDYLCQRRQLAVLLLQPLLESGKLYADSRGNAVFLLVAGKANLPVGAELRGTGPRIWRGMAPGTRKDMGYFCVGAKGSRHLVLCESAIDAISCYQIHPERICISTSGVRASPCWLGGLIARGYEIDCGFDADEAGVVELSLGIGASIEARWEPGSFRSW